MKSNVQMTMENIKTYLEEKSGIIILQKCLAKGRGLYHKL